MGEQRYYPFGASRPGGMGTLPTDFTFTGQRAEAGLGLMDYHARFYSPRLGRFINADTLVPNPGNPQDLNRYTYARNAPLTYIDADGHFPWLVVGIVALAVVVWASMEMPVGEGAPPYDPGAMYWHGIETAIKWGGDTPGDVYALIDEWPENRVSNALAIGLVAVPSGVVKAVSKFEDVRHATQARWVQSVLNGIDLRKIREPGRFGKAFYVAEEGGTAVAEVAAHGGQASHVIRFQLDLSKAKVLDLTDPAVAKAWGYVEDVEGYAAHQALAQKAVEEGYNVIRYRSYRGTGYNYALLKSDVNPFNFDEWLIPQMVSPVAP
ncbi:MAG: RES domain-containing protein [Anaerolineae bacterium]|nr:RES domain-containing protein [Anaerolineae bacterium]